MANFLLTQKVVPIGQRTEIPNKVHIHLLSQIDFYLISSNSHIGKSAGGAASGEPVLKVINSITRELVSFIKLILMSIIPFV